MSHDISESGNTYVANINVNITSPDRYQLVLDDPSPDSFLIELGATGDGRFAINAAPGQPCPYSAIEFVFTVGEGYAFDSRGFMDCARVRNSGWSFGPARISGSQCSVTAQISAGTGTFDDYVLFCQALSSPTPTLLEIGPKARRGKRLFSHGAAPDDDTSAGQRITGFIEEDDDTSAGQRITGFTEEDEESGGPGRITGHDD